MLLNIVPINTTMKKAPFKTLLLNMPTIALLAGETKDSFARWLAKTFDVKVCKQISSLHGKS